MALNDLPKVDRSSLNSNESAIALSRLINMTTGFIMREDVPDYGCDFDVEMVKDGAMASDWRFALQLKSMQQPIFIQNGAFVSYSFKTSRLGYLLRRQPAYGLVVLYDVNGKTLYYDYADEIFNRLMTDRGSEDWKGLEHVNILIPSGNILSVDSVKALHQKFISRFEQAALMQHSHGAKYGLPTVSIEPKTGYDFNNLEDIKSALKKWGFSLLTQFDLQIVYTLIIELPAAEIISDKELCFIALITYAESGRHAESVYFTQRIRKRFELSEFEKGSVDFIELKNKLRLGDLSLREYIEGTKKLLPTVEDVNSLTLRVNLLYFELSLIKLLEPMPPKLSKEIQQLFCDIEDAEVDNLYKQYLKIWNANNLSSWIGHFRSEGFTEISIRENMGTPFSLAERTAKAQRLIRVYNMFYFVLDEINQYTKKNDNKLLHAHVVKILIKFELDLEIDKISNDGPEVAEDGLKIPNRLVQARDAFNIFLEHSLFHDAYQLLLLQMDLYYVGRNRYHLDDSFNIGPFQVLKAQMEKEFEFNDELSVPALLERKKTEKDNKPANMSFLKGYNDAQLDTLAEVMMRSGKFPNADKSNIIGQMKSYQLFYKRCKDLTIEVQEVSLPDRIAYADPVVFVFKNRHTGIVSVSSSDMEGLLRSWGY